MDQGTAYARRSITPKVRRAERSSRHHSANVRPKLTLAAALAQKTIERDAPSRLNNLDFIRFVLAAAVVVSHSYALMNGRARTEPVFVFSRGQVTLGHAAVCGFFIISGYLIAMSWERSRGASDYFRRRVLRIYPGFAAAICFGAFVVLPLAGRPFGFSGSEVGYLGYQMAALEMPLRDPTAFPHNPVSGFVNGSLWTIRYEFWCYVLIAAAGTCGLFRAGRRWMLAAALAAAFAMLVAVKGFGWDAQWPCAARSPVCGWLFGLVGSLNVWPALATSFLSGTLYYLLREQMGRNGLASAALAAIAGAAMLVAAKTPPLLAIVLPIALPFPLFWLAFIPSRLAGFARRGDYSYGLYLYAFPIQQLVICYRPAISVTAMILVSLLLSLIAGVCSWHLVERWFIRLKSTPASPRGQCDAAADSK